MWKFDEEMYCKGLDDTVLKCCPDGSGDGKGVARPSGQGREEFLLKGGGVRSARFGWVGLLSTYYNKLSGIKHSVK